MSDQNEIRLSWLLLLKAIGNVKLGSNAYLLAWDIDKAQTSEVKEWIMQRHDGWEVTINFTSEDKRLMISCKSK